MTLKELKERISHLDERYDELEVCIPNNKKGMYGGMPVTNVKNVGKGFDWNSGKFIIWPETEMVEMTKVGNDGFEFDAGSTYPPLKTKKCKECFDRKPIDELNQNDGLCNECADELNNIMGS